MSESKGVVSKVYFTKVYKAAEKVAAGRYSVVTGDALERRATHGKADRPASVPVKPSKVK